MNETLLRVLTALILIPMILVPLHYGSVWWVGTALLAALLALNEYYGLVEARGYKPFRREGYIGAVIFVMAAWTLHAQIMLFVITATILGIFFAQLARRTVATAITSISATIVGVLYIPWLLSHGILLRGLEYNGRNVGEMLVVFCMATTFLADTGGYFFGRAWGKHKIIPSISPKKSWEGLFGSVIFSMVAGILVVLVYNAWIYPSPIGFEVAAAVGALNALVGLAGDLVESTLKRDADVKDAGSLLPGHGGMLDRIDGLLFTLPVDFLIFFYLLQS